MGGASGRAVLRELQKLSSRLDTLDGGRRNFLGIACLDVQGVGLQSSQLALGLATEMLDSRSGRPHRTLEGLRTLADGTEKVQLLERGWS